MRRVPFWPMVVGTGFGSGFWPYGPGTAGALLATLLWYVLSLFLSGAWLLAVTFLCIIIFYVLGVWAANRLSRYWGKDPSRVVIDEMVGVWIALLAAPAGSLAYAMASFVLFRFFDIVKPLGVRHMERMHGGHGVMMDDVLAGIYSFFLIFLYRDAFLPLCV